MPFQSSAANRSAPSSLENHFVVSPNPPVPQQAEGHLVYHDHPHACIAPRGLYSTPSRLRPCPALSLRQVPVKVSSECISHLRARRVIRINNLKPTRMNFRQIIRIRSADWSVMISNCCPRAGIQKSRLRTGELYSDTLIHMGTWQHSGITRCLRRLHRQLKSQFERFLNR